MEPTPRRRSTVALGIAVLSGGALVVGVTLCATGGTVGGWPDERGWAGFLLLLGAGFGLVVALFTFLLALLFARGDKQAAFVACLLLVAVGGGGWLLLGTDLWFYVNGFPFLVLAADAGVVAIPFALWQASLWRRRSS